MSLLQKKRFFRRGRKSLFLLTCVVFLNGCEKDPTQARIEKAILDISQGRYPSLLNLPQFYKKNPRLQFFVTGYSPLTDCDDLHRQGSSLISLVILSSVMGGGNFRSCMGENERGNTNLFGPGDMPSLPAQKLKTGQGRATQVKNQSPLLEETNYP
jgi:hypothetical protein